MGTLRDELKFAWKYKAVPGEFGIEIEAETESQNAYPAGFLQEKYDEKTYKVYIDAPLLPSWAVHHDSSLRNYGFEYVFKKPYDFQKALEVLDEFAGNTKGIKFIQDSPSTSVHVHVNIGNETALTMGNFLTVYMLYENVLVEYSGPLRRSNLFALPTRVAEQTANNIVRMFKRYEEADPQSINYNAESVKYAALNLACLTTLGSLEVRSFRGTTDVQAIKRWLSIINRILVFSRTMGMTPRDILRMYRNDSDDLFHNVFEFNAVLLKDNIPPVDFELMVEKNLWFAKEIAASVKSWEKINTIFADTPRPEKPKKLVNKLEVLEFNPFDGQLIPAILTPWQDMLTPNQVDETLQPVANAAYELSDWIDDNDFENELEG